MPTMIRDKEQFPVGPHTADVHPDEVENYRLGGWVEADQAEAPKRGRKPKGDAE